MIFLILASIQTAATGAPSLPPAPPMPPPYTHKVEVMSELLGHEVSDEFKRCGDARTNDSGRYVEAMGTPRFSAAWKIATEKTSNALIICHSLRRALRERKDFLLDVIANGEKYDSDLAVPDMRGTASELEGVDHFLDEETIRYSNLLREGWGDPHCVAKADGYMPAYSICPKTSD